MTNLTDLASRIEAADGAIRDLDAEIWAALHGGYIELSGGPDRDRRVVWYDDKGWVKHAVSLGDGMVRERKMLGDVRDAPAYTGSIDAAMSLVPEGWRIDSLREHLTPFPRTRVGLACWNEEAIGNAKTPALALAGAALRARAS